MENVKVSNPVDWKEIGITFGITLVATVAAVSLVQFVIVPAANKIKEKKRQRAAEKK